MTFDIATRPKAELHCHIDGLLSPRLLRRMAQQGHAIGAHADRLAAIHPVDGVAAWVERYMPLVNELFTPKDVWLPIILTYHLEELIAQHTVYAEIFVSNLLFARPDEAQTVDLFASLRRLVDDTTRGRMVTGSRRAAWAPRVGADERPAPRRVEQSFGFRPFSRRSIFDIKT